LKGGGGLASPMVSPRTEYWDRLYLGDPDYFGPQASPLARASLGPLAREGGGGRLVELGCGTGRDLCYFAQHGFRVEGCDLSPVAARLANERLARLRGEASPVAHVRAEDARSYLGRLGDREIDVVYSNLYLNLEMEESVPFVLLREVYRVLRPSGWCIFSVRSHRDPWYGVGTPIGPDRFDPGDGRPPLRFYSEAQVRSMLGEGFLVVSLREHPDGEPEFPISVVSAVAQRRD
jgi:SAM-dependent methyltransferase